MPVDLAVDVERRLVSVVGYGLLTGAELRDVDAKLRVDPDARPEFNELLDYTDVTESVVTADDLFALAQKPPFFRPTCKRALIGRGPLDYGNMRMFEILRDGAAGEWRFFHTRAAAEHWLTEAEDASATG
jgi:hypothetical protein